MTLARKSWIVSCQLAWTLFFGAASVYAQEQPHQEPLVLSGENTVIVNCGEQQIPSHLQYYLMKYVARHPDAAGYRPGEKVDRSAASIYPIVDLSRANTIEDNKRRIYIGDIGRIPEGLLAPAQRDKVAKGRPGNILIARQGNSIILTDNRVDPWYFAVMTAFLDRLGGVRMYMPAGADGLEWVSQPGQPTITVPVHYEHFQEPRFAQVIFAGAGPDHVIEWRRLNAALNDGVNLKAGHYVAGYFEPDKYYDRYPQLYPMDASGERKKPVGDAWNPCVGADPDLAAEVVMEGVREKKPKLVNLGIMDTPYACKCPACKDANPSNVWFNFLNKVARKLQVEFPHLNIVTFRYININVPDDMPIEPNIVLTVVTKSYHGVTDRGEGLYWGPRSIARTGAGYTLHDWNFQANTPRIYSRQLASFYQWGAANGMRGIYMEWSPQDGWYLHGAHYWINAQLLSDPYQDTDLLWRQYCQDMFGDGWEPMYRFYDMFAQKHVVSDQYYERADWPRYEAAGFSPQDLAQQRAWLDDAVARTRDDALIQKRLDAVARYFVAHEMLARATFEPYRLYWNHSVVNKRADVNSQALAFYVNDTAQAVLDFDEYYNNTRVVAPDSNDYEDQYGGVRFSFRGMYGKGLGEVFRAIRGEAMQSVNATEGTVDSFRQFQRRLAESFRSHLPASYNKQRADDLERLLTTKALIIPRVDTMPKIDGDLSDAIWERGAVLDGFTLADLFLPSVEGNESMGRIMRVGDHLLIGLECRQPKGIYAVTPPDAASGSRIWREACIEVFIERIAPGEEKRDYVQYVVNALGGFRAFQKADGNRENTMVVSRMNAEGTAYTLEIALPLKVDGRYDYTDQRVVNFNLIHYPYWEKKQNSRERIGWAPVFSGSGHEPASVTPVYME